MDTQAGVGRPLPRFSWCGQTVGLPEGQSWIRRPTSSGGHPAFLLVWADCWLTARPLMITQANLVRRSPPLFSWGGPTVGLPDGQSWIRRPTLSGGHPAFLLGWANCWLTGWAVMDTQAGVGRPLPRSSPGVGQLLVCWKVSHGYACQRWPAARRARPKGSFLADPQKGGRS